MGFIILGSLFIICCVLATTFDIKGCAIIATLFIVTMIVMFFVGMSDVGKHDEIYTEITYTEMIELPNGLSQNDIEQSYEVLTFVDTPLFRYVIKEYGDNNNSYNISKLLTKYSLSNDECEYKYYKKEIEYLSDKSKFIQFWFGKNPWLIESEIIYHTGESSVYAIKK